MVDKHPFLSYHIGLLCPWVSHSGCYMANYYEDYRAGNQMTGPKNGGLWIFSTDELTIPKPPGYGKLPDITLGGDWTVRR